MTNGKRWNVLVDGYWVGSVEAGDEGSAKSAAVVHFDLEVDGHPKYQSLEVLEIGDVPDWALPVDQYQEAMDYESNAEYDRWDGYGDPDPCDRSPELDDELQAAYARRQEEDREAWAAVQEAIGDPRADELPF